MSSSVTSRPAPVEATPAVTGKMRAALHAMVSAIEAWIERGPCGPIQIQGLWREEAEGILQDCAAVLAATSFDAASARPGIAADVEPVSRRATLLLESFAQQDSPSGKEPDERVEDLAQGIRSLESTIKTSAPEPAAERPDNGPARDRKAASASRGVVLVVDDDRGNRDVLSRRLLRDKREVMLAEGGRQALRMLSRYQFDLVILDVMMPDVDGVQVLGEIKGDPRWQHLPVIMITAVDDIETVVRCLEMGADDYISKPFNAVVLRVRIDSLLDRKWLRDAEQRKNDALNAALSGLRQEQERASSLLLNILPPMVAEELQAHGSSEPMYFEDVSIVFADVVGFTLSTEQLPADVLVDLLHRYFTAYDHIISRYRLEKLKTIGDSYMYAGGIPVRSPSHPVDCVLAALEMVDATAELARSGPVEWKIRVGVNTGPVIAGVVGVHKFAFDIWGDAVNMASRMESCGAPNKVNLSASTYMRVKDFFACEKRERIRIKDGREVETYLVSAIGASPRNGKAVPVREAFGARYRTYFRRDLTAFPECPAALPAAAGKVKA